MTENERIAKLEAKEIERDRRIEEMQRDIREIKKAVTSWRGVILGVALTVSFLWTGLTGAWNFLKHKVGA